MGVFYIPLKWQAISWLSLSDVTLVILRCRSLGGT